MQNGNDQKIKTLLKLKDQTWARFDSRRRMQWKTDISIWTVLVAILALISKGDIPDINLPMKIIATIAGIILFVLHLIWSIDIGQAFQIDNKTSWSLEKIILGALDVCHEENLKADIDDRTQKSGTLKIWGHFLETGITFILIICLGVIFWAS